MAVRAAAPTWCEHGVETHENEGVDVRVLNLKGKGVVGCKEVLMVGQVVV